VFRGIFNFFIVKIFIETEHRQRHRKVDGALAPGEKGQKKNKSPKIAQREKFDGIGKISLDGNPEPRRGGAWVSDFNRGSVAA